MANPSNVATNGNVTKPIVDDDISCPDLMPPAWLHASTLQLQYKLLQKIQIKKLAISIHRELAGGGNAMQAARARAGQGLQLCERGRDAQQ
uniref:Uncharacterized protein n=1 Tax=Oryza rufipogon TaxID=4529 RepID=A0A0E0N8J6_ORYRU